MPPVKRAQIIARLEEHQIPFTELPLQNGVTLLISQLGGRVYGPFLTPESESLYWVPPIFKDAAAFTSHLAEGWNFGGERFWIIPEIQYLVRDRWDYFGSLFIPRAMDPGMWKLEKVSQDRWRLSQDLTLEAYNLASGQKSLHIEATIAPAPNPLRHLSAQAELMAGVTYAGYEETVLLCEIARDDILSAVWNLVMLNPGGELFIPCTPRAEATCYKGDLDPRVLELNRHYARLQITGDQMYKAGFKAAHTFGRMAYMQRREDGDSYLLVRSFSTHPSSEYPEEPPDMPGRRGDAILVYNDDGGFGDMGEMECSGQTIGGSTGRSEGIDSLALYLFTGPVDRLQAILVEMLGIEL
jgi:hypothetical protein